MFLHGLVLVLYFLSAHALSKLRPLQGEVEHVLLDKIPTPNDRVERSIGGECQFPHLLSFRFEIQDEEFILHLQKNDRLQTNVPIFVSVNGTIERKETEENSNIALYQDVNRGSAMLVSCEDDGAFSLHGSFHHDGEMYHMSPSDVIESWHNHFIQKHPSNNGNYLNDFVIPPPDGANAGQNSGGSTRERRQAIDENVVELLISADVSIYEHFLADEGTDPAAEVAVQQYMSLLVNEIDLHYISVGMVDPSINIRVYLSGVIIAKTAEDAAWSIASQEVDAGNTYLNMSAILYNVAVWRYYQPLSNLPQHDHMMALSMIDLADVSSSPPNTNVEGIAFVGTVCDSIYMVSFVEVDGSRVSLVAAHELGHGLGSWHDGNSDFASSCSPSDNYIMTSEFSPTTGESYAEAQWTFSQCSVDAFKSYINGLSNNCMLQHAFAESDYEQIQREKQLPGSVYSLDQQCQMYNGQSSTSCRPTISEEECYSGYPCSWGASCDISYVRLYPLAGTPCGSPSDNKLCYRGLCDNRTIIATTTTTTESSKMSSTTISTTSSTPSTTRSTTSQTTSTTSSTPSTTSSKSSTSSTTSSTPSTTRTTTSPTTSTTSSTPLTTRTTTSPTTSTTSSTPLTTRTTASPTTSTTSSTPLTTRTTASPTTSTTSSTPLTTRTTTSPTSSTTSSTPLTTRTTASPTTSTTSSTPLTTRTTTSPTTSTTSSTPLTTRTTTSPTTSTTSSTPLTTRTTTSPTTSTTSSTPSTTRTTTSPTSSTTSSTPSTTRTTTLPTTSTTSSTPTTTRTTTSPTTSTTSSTPLTTRTTTSPTTSTTSTTPSTTSSTASPTTSTNYSTTSTTSSTTSPTTSTTSSSPSTITSTSPTTSTTSSSPSTTRSTITTMSTSTSVSSSTSTTSNFPTTTVFTTTPCSNKRCCIKLPWQKKRCCRGQDCCQYGWATETSCYSNCCADYTGPAPTQSPYCRRRCCKYKGSGKNRTKICCTGNDCCRHNWGNKYSCCRYCPNENGN